MQNVHIFVETPRSRRLLLFRKGENISHYVFIENYGDSDWKHPYQALENPVHFYLNGDTVFSELSHYMATGGKYGISFSLMSDISTVKRLYGDDAKALFGNADTILLLEADRLEAGLFKEIVPMPDQSEEDICELIGKDKAAIKIRGYAPIICDILR